MDALPKDPAMLLSFVNMKLRDEFPDLEELCAAYGTKSGEIKEALKKIDYEYNPQANQFR